MKTPLLALFLGGLLLLAGCGAQAVQEETPTVLAAKANILGKTLVFIGVNNTLETDVVVNPNLFKLVDDQGVKHDFTTFKVIQGEGSEEELSETATSKVAKAHEIFSFALNFDLPPSKAIYIVAEPNAFGNAGEVRIEFVEQESPTSSETSASSNQTPPPGPEAPQIVCGDNSDGQCPEECTYFSDDDCPVYRVGETAISEEGIEVTLNGSWRYQTCRYELAELEPWYFYIVGVKIRNNGTVKQVVSERDFELIDSEGNQYIVFEPVADCDEYPSPEYYYGGSYWPNTGEENDLWFHINTEELPPGEKKIVYDPNPAFVEGNEIIFLVD